MLRETVLVRAQLVALAWGEVTGHSGGCQSLLSLL